MNVGSSSLKITAFLGDQVEVRAANERTNQTIRQTGPQLVEKKEQDICSSLLPEFNSSSLLQNTLDQLAKRLSGQPVAAVGHRVVHGGCSLQAPVRITPTVLSELEALIPLAPSHQPASLAAIQMAMLLLPKVPHIACFDTAFHLSMPKHEKMLGLPRAYFEKGIRRYGFHGLSYESIASRLPLIDSSAATGKTVICHLGSGSSLCALLDGKSIATTMSFTPLDGLLMSTRAGAIDPGVVLYLLRHEQQTPDQIEQLLAHESGLLGVSGISSDVRDLLNSDAPQAAEAVDLFCYRVAREIGSMVAALDGLDAIVFTGGIGENSPQIRDKICARLGWLGAQLDCSANQTGSTLLSTLTSRVSILCIPSNEEVIIAKYTRSFINDSPKNSTR